MATIEEYALLTAASYPAAPIALQAPNSARLELSTTTQKALWHGQRRIRPLGL